MTCYAKLLYYYCRRVTAALVRCIERPGVSSVRSGLLCSAATALYTGCCETLLKAAAATTSAGTGIAAVTDSGITSTVHMPAAAKAALVAALQAVHRALR
jgi:hypothetical protein